MKACSNIQKSNALQPHKLPRQNDSSDTKIKNITSLLNEIEMVLCLVESKNYSIHTEVFGMIQGVGFRPFVATLAHFLGLNGSVRNHNNNAKIILNISQTTKTESILLFYSTLISACGHSHENAIMQKEKKLLSKMHTPKQAFIESLHFTFIDTLDSDVDSKGFRILSSSLTTNQKYPKIAQNATIQNTKKDLKAHIPLDTKICEKCLHDMYDEKSRFHNYPFTSCINCGARYSIIYKLPYDRKNTSMKDIELCKDCKKDYENLQNRRFHTEPIGCSACPIETRLYSLRLNEDSIIKSEVSYNLEAIKSIANALINNKIVLFKGLGGFAYITNARNTESLKLVRSIKMRKHKPFVVMARLQTLQNIALITQNIESLLKSPQAPIVLTPKHANYNLSEEVSALQTVGVMIPYTAMLDLIFSHLPSDFALIYTSANNKGEMIATSLDDLSLDSIIQHTKELFILDYERAIVNCLDDSIALGIAWEKDSIREKSIMQKDLNARLMRLSRGFAPLHLKSSLDLKKLCVAFGAMQKSSLAFGMENNIVVSPYMGDLFTLKNIENFRKNFDYFSKIYGKLEALISDKHPRYISTTLAKEVAKQNSIPLFQVAHHHAHFNALLLEAGERQGVGVIFDGSGLGDDGTLWGGEFLCGDSKRVDRIFHFKPFMLLGGENHLKDSRRLAYSYALCNNLYPLQSFIESTYSVQDFQILKQLHNSKTSHLCSSVGRLFDIAGFILGLSTLSYEAQSGEIIASNALKCAYRILSPKNLHYDSLMNSFVNLPFNPYPFKIDKGQIDISECFLAMFNDSCINHLLNNSTANNATKNNPSLNDFIALNNSGGKNECDIALRFIDTLAHCILESLQIIGTDYALFGGGVFANYALCIRTKELLGQHNIKAFFPQLPCNDYSISIGQLAHIQHLI